MAECARHAAVRQDMMSPCSRGSQKWRSSIEEMLRYWQADLPEGLGR